MAVTPYISTLTFIAMPQRRQTAFYFIHSRDFRPSVQCVMCIQRRSGLAWIGLCIVEESANFDVLVFSVCVHFSILFLPFVIVVLE